MTTSEGKSRKTIVTVSAVAVMLAFFVVCAIERFGADKVQAFAGVMSFLAVVVAAYATVLYVQKTSEIVCATRSSAEQQARVAKLMEQDLRLRIAPHLRYEPLAGHANVPEAHIRNAGSGVAVEIRATVSFVPSGHTINLNLVPSVLEPRHDHAERVWFNNEPTSTGYSVLLTCKDSLRSNDYQFKWNQAGKLIDSSVVPRA
jgi:hypothetical protein